MIAKLGLANPNYFVAPIRARARADEPFIAYRSEEKDRAFADVLR
jgi:hypothetical protein